MMYDSEGPCYIFCFGLQDPKIIPLTTNLVSKGAGTWPKSHATISFIEEVEKGHKQALILPIERFNNESHLDAMMLLLLFICLWHCFHIELGVRH